MDIITGFDAIKSYEKEFFDMFDELVAEAAGLPENTQSEEHKNTWCSMTLKLFALLQMSVKIGWKLEGMGGQHDVGRN
ncbi:MAG: hypothetical protein L7F77_11365 [Candidatus Magnetominusculus sp. LBB02]|nr:hypothetical protein [Candidatus Magnetominusculus sp. LBB02]